MCQRHSIKRYYEVSQRSGWQNLFFAHKRIASLSLQKSGKKEGGTLRRVDTMREGRFVVLIFLQFMARAGKRALCAFHDLRAIVKRRQLHLRRGPEPGNELFTFACQ